MSKLSNALQTSSLGTRYARQSRGGPYIEAVESFTPSPYITGKEYTIELKIGTRVKCSEERALPLAVHNAKRSILHEVLGEFMEPINKIRIALLDDDVDRALRELSNLQDQMFSVGVTP